jgi:hypothetical protein
MQVLSEPARRTLLTAVNASAKGGSDYSRFLLFQLGGDLDEITGMHLYPIAAKDTLVTSRSRFHLSYKWAHIARVLRHPTTLTAYKTAISLTDA